METKLSCWSGYFYDLPFEKAIDEFIKNGLYATELSSEHGKELLERSDDVAATGASVRDFLRSRNFEMTQGHLPLRFKIVEERDELSLLLRYIDLYEACGVKNMVLHCDRLYSNPDLTTEERISENVKSLRMIAEHIKGRDVHICLENLRQDPSLGFREILPVGLADGLLEIIRRTGSDRFAICLDTGHLHLVGGNQAEFIRNAGEHLRALHIADNQGREDQHMMPFGRGTVDFLEVVRTLREIGYRGLFNLEIPGESHIPIEIRREKIKYIRSVYDYLLRATEA